MKRAYLTAKEVEKKLTALRTLRGYKLLRKLRSTKTRLKKQKQSAEMETKQSFQSILFSTYSGMAKNVERKKSRRHRKELSTL